MILVLYSQELPDVPCGGLSLAKRNLCASSLQVFPTSPLLVDVFGSTRKLPLCFLHFSCMGQASKYFSVTVVSVMSVVQACNAKYCSHVELHGRVLNHSDVVIDSGERDQKGILDLAEGGGGGGKRESST